MQEKQTKNFSQPHKKTKVNRLHVTPVNQFCANKFSKQQQQHSQALKPDRLLYFFTKSLAIVTMLSTN